MKWINVKNRLPEETDDVLCWLNGAVEVIGYQPEKGFFDMDYDMALINYTKSVTHWMPLPDKPID